MALVRKWHFSSIIFFLLKCRQFHVLRLVLIKKIKINGTFYDRLCVHKRSLNRKPRDQVTSAMPLRSQEHPVRAISPLDPDSFMSWRGELDELTSFSAQMLDHFSWQDPLFPKSFWLGCVFCQALQQLLIDTVQSLSVNTLRVVRRRPLSFHKKPISKTVQSGDRGDVRKHLAQRILSSLASEACWKYPAQCLALNSLLGV